MAEIKPPRFESAYYRLGPSALVPLARGRIRDFSDPMSNAISMSRTDIRAMLKNATFGNMRLSDQGLRFFLHEVTHHTTFANIVGSARSALAVSVCGRASIGPQPTERAGLWIGQRDDIVLRFFETVMGPLI